MVIILHRCSYDNSTISSVNKLTQYDASLLFSLLSLFFLSLFFLICFSSLCQICQRVVLLNLLDTKVNPNMVTAIDWSSHTTHDWIWLISYFGFNDPLRQYFSLYRAVSQRGRKKRKKIDERKCSNNPLPHLLQAQYSLALLFSKLVGRRSTENLPSTITPSPSRLDFDDSLSFSL